MRIGNKTKQTIKQQILDVLPSDFFLSTFKVAEKVGRSWQFTNELLTEMERDDLINSAKVGNVLAWKKNSGVAHGETKKKRKRQKRK